MKERNGLTTTTSSEIRTPPDQGHDPLPRQNEGREGATERRGRMEGVEGGAEGEEGPRGGKARVKGGAKGRDRLRGEMDQLEGGTEGRD